MSCLQLYVHLTWSTHERLNLITTEIESRLWALIAARCNAMGARAIEVGGMPDHVHTLAEFRPDLALSDLVRDLKGGSSHAMSHDLLPGRWFRWQDGYGAFTVRREDLEEVSRYIREQKAHHAKGSVIEKWETSESARRARSRAASARSEEWLAFNPFAGAKG